MSAFELRDRNSDNNSVNEIADNIETTRCRTREDCIIALKVYDSCRQQDCCTRNEIGPARAAETTNLGGECINEGDVIDPPDDAAAVTIDRLRVKKIIIVSKEPSPFKNGFWDIDLKYVFVYRLTFREADGSVIGSIKANSIFNKRVTLFGSIGTDLVISTDLFSTCNDSTTLDSDPFILVEAKAVPLAAELKYQRRINRGPVDYSPEPNEVNVTIGLFSIVQLFRIVNLAVETKGFCVPEECDEINPLNPCEFFDSLDFPMDIFAPPLRSDFLAGVSNNIPRELNGGRDCGC